MKYLIFLFLMSCTPGAYYSLHEVNDFFAPTKNYDSMFTQGLKLSSNIPDETGSHGYSVGQNFYTPGHKQTVEPQPDDRPYAGLLYGDYEKNILTGDNVQDTFKATVGIVGPHAYGKETQKTLHKWLGQRYPQGWGNQLHDELGLMGTYERKKNHSLNGYSDYQTVVGGNLGNIFTQAYASFIFRLGHNLPPFYHTGNVVFPRVPKPTVSLRYYLFGGPLVRGVARNIFLDGNTFRDSASIDKRPFVAEGRLGVGFEYGNWRLLYTYMVQTEEFKGEGNDFGEIEIGRTW